MEMDGGFLVMVQYDGHYGQLTAGTDLTLTQTLPLINA